MQFVSTDKVAEDQLEDVYIDMDLSLPQSNSYRKRPSNASNSPDFEFNMSSKPGAYDTADDLFFNGQLLPLHISPRVLMVQRLSSSRHPSQVQQREMEAEAKQSGGCTLWDLWGKDFQENSYRHSNGSSQDSCFSSKDHLHFTPRERSMSCSQHFGSGQAAEKSSSWLTAAFQWKVLFGFRKSISKMKGNNLSRSPRSEDKKQEPNNFCAHQAKSVSSSLRINKGTCRIAADINEEIQKTEDYFGQKCMKPSKLERGSSPIKHESRSRLKEQFWIEETSAESNPTNFSSKYGSSFAKQPSCSSFLPRNLRVASLVSWRSSAPSSRVNSSQCSPTHTGDMMCSFNYRTISDMQNSVQGAIAYCKQSHASKQALF